MTIEQKVRGLCRLMLFARNDDYVYRLIPRFRKAINELGVCCGGRTAKSGVFRSMRHVRGEDNNPRVFFNERSNIFRLTNLRGKPY